jgi:hypothetical protein
MSALLVALNCLLPIGRRADIAAVALRQIRPDDAAALQGFVRALSPASRRLRFHAALNELSEATLKALTRVDQRGHVAFVLTVTEHGAERIDAARAAGLRWLLGEVLVGNARMLAFMRRCGFAVTTRGVEPGLVPVERSVDRLLPAAQPAEARTGIARRRIRCLLAGLWPASRESGSVLQPF